MGTPSASWSAERCLRPPSETYLRAAPAERLPPPSARRGGVRLAARELVFLAAQYRIDGHLRGASSLGRSRHCCGSLYSMRSGRRTTVRHVWLRRKIRIPAPAGPISACGSRISSTASIRAASAGVSICSLRRSRSASPGWHGCRAPRRDIGAVYFFIVLPVLSFVLLSGVPLLGLISVPTSLWGGILVTIVVATVGIVVSLAARHFAGAGAALRYSRGQVLLDRRSSNSSAACR